MAYRVVDYEVGGAERGTFDSFDKAKDWAEILLLMEDKEFSVIEEDEDGNGTEIWTTKDLEWRKRR